MTVKDNKSVNWLKIFFKIGGVSVYIYTYVRYNQVFEAYLAKGLSRNKAYDLAADECGTCRITIIKAVKFMNQEIENPE